MEPVESFQPEPLQLLIIGCIPKGLHQRTINPQLTFWSQITFASVKTRSESNLLFSLYLHLLLGNSLNCPETV